MLQHDSFIIPISKATYHRLHHQPQVPLHLLHLQRAMRSDLPFVPCQTLTKSAVPYNCSNNWNNWSAGDSKVVGGGSKTVMPRQNVCQQGLYQGIHTACVRITGIPLVEVGFIVILIDHDESFKASHFDSLGLFSNSSHHPWPARAEHPWTRRCSRLSA